MATVKTVTIKIDARGQFKEERVRVPLNATEIATIHIQERKLGNKIKTNGFYFGANTAGLTSVASLARKEQAQLYGSFSATAGTTDKVYFAHPKRLGLAIGNIFGLTGYFKSPTVITVTDIGGYSEDYYLYESISDNLGQVTVYIKPQTL